MELPDTLVLAVSGFAVLFVLSHTLSGPDARSELIGAITGAALLFGLFYLLFQVSKGRWIGGGDVKLAPALGLLAGTPLKTVLLLFIASLAGTIIGIPLLVKRKNKRNIKLPFGPLLIIALLIVFFVGQDIIDWYKTDILYL